MTSEDAKTVFKDALDELQATLTRRPHLSEIFPSDKLPDILATSISDGKLGSDEIYDHRWLERKFLVSPKLYECFDRFWLDFGTDRLSKGRMCKLFFLHEFYHLTQGIDSNTYRFSKNTKASIAQYDYAADAIAVRLLFEAELPSPGPWHLHLASVLESHILCGEVFSYADDNRKAEIISGERLKRQLIWHLQYARSRSFNPIKTFSDFDLGSPLDVEVLRLEPTERRENLTNKREVNPSDLEMIELHVNWHGKRRIHSMTLPYVTGNLLRGLFQYELDATVLAFRALFDSHLEMVGRVREPEAQTDKGTFDWDDLEKLTVSLFPQGPNENEFWSRSGGNKASLQTTMSGRAQWHIALNLLKNGGGGLTLAEFVQSLRNEFPENEDVTNLAER